MQRIGWEEIPDSLRDLIADALGSPVAGFDSAAGGFSPCLAGKARLADGRVVFLKAVSARQNPDSPEMLRRELEAADLLPEEVPAPRLLAKVEDNGWVAAAFEFVAGRLPRRPWDPDELGQALRALTALGTVPAPSGLPSARERLAPLFDGWRTFRGGGSTVPIGWWSERVDDLVQLEEAALDSLYGNRLVHNDVRADNILIGRRGEVCFVDWAHPCAGPPWLDLILWLPALELEGGGTPEEVLAKSFLGAQAEADAVTAVVAASAGYFLHRSTLPDPPGLPTVRAFQRAQAETSLAWLDRRLTPPR